VAGKEPRVLWAHLVASTTQRDRCAGALAVLRVGSEGLTGPGSSAPPADSREEQSRSRRERGEGRGGNGGRT
jgi:hypothetical protein